MEKQWFTFFNFVTGYLKGDIYIYIYIYTLSRSKERKWFHIKKTRSRQYLTETMTDADGVHALELLANTST